MVLLTTSARSRSGSLGSLPPIDASRARYSRRLLQHLNDAGACNCTPCPRSHWRPNSRDGALKRKSSRIGIDRALLDNKSRPAQSCKYLFHAAHERGASAGQIKDVTHMFESTRRDRDAQWKANAEARRMDDEAEWDRELADARLRWVQAEDTFTSRPWESIVAQVEAELRAKYEKDAAEQAAATEKAKEGIFDHLIKAGEDADFAGKVIAQMQADDKNWLLNVFAEGNLNIDAINVFYLDMKNSSLAVVRDRLRNSFPEWNLTELQKKAVINRIFQIFSSSELLALQPQLNCYADALMIEAGQNTAFQCPICTDQLITQGADGVIDTSNVWFAPHRRTEHWSNNPCGHTFCRSCMARWAETAIDEHKLRIKCPAAGCSYSLWQQDLQELVRCESFARHQEHRNADYLQHLRACVKDDAELKTWLKSNARPCPDCHVIISRSEGCNFMQCVCGTRFCYKCGCKQCRCNAGRRRADIWNPG